MECYWIPSHQRVPGKEEADRLGKAAARDGRVLKHGTQQCYTNDTNRAKCRNFIKPKLEAQIKRNASCPFEEKMFRSANRNIRLDTGLPYDHEYFGANVPQHLRFAHRLVTYCVSLITEWYKEAFPISQQP